MNIVNSCPVGVHVVSAPLGCWLPWCLRWCRCVRMFDCQAPSDPCVWRLSGEVEKVVWNHFRPESFLVGLSCVTLHWQPPLKHGASCCWACLLAVALAVVRYCHRARPCSVPWVCRGSLLTHLLCLPSGKHRGWSGGWTEERQPG